MEKLKKKKHKKEKENKKLCFVIRNIIKSYYSMQWNLLSYLIVTLL